MNNNQPVEGSTSEEVKQNYYKKLQQARVGNQLINEEQRIRQQKESNPELFNLIETIGNKGGMPMLKQLHVMLSRYIALSEYNGGKVK